jgi:hypothetical protein
MKVTFSEKEYEDIASRVLLLINKNLPLADKTSDSSRTYNCKEVALISGKNAQTIRKHLRKGQLMGNRAGGSWIISNDALNKYIGKDE